MHFSFMGSVIIGKLSICNGADTGVGMKSFNWDLRSDSSLTMYVGLLMLVGKLSPRNSRTANPERVKNAQCKARCY